MPGTGELTCVEGSMDVLFMGCVVVAVKLGLKILEFSSAVVTGIGKGLVDCGGYGLSVFPDCWVGAIGVKLDAGSGDGLSSVDDNIGVASGVVQSGVGRTAEIVKGVVSSAAVVPAKLGLSNVPGMFAKRGLGDVGTEMMVLLFEVVGC